MPMAVAQPSSRPRRCSRSTTRARYPNGPPTRRLDDSMSVFSRILRAGEGKKIRALQSIVPDINALEPEIHALSDDALRHKTVEFRERVAQAAAAGEDPEEVLNDLL